MPNDDLPLTGFQSRFAELFVTYRDLERVSKALRIKKSEGRALYRNPRIRSVIDAGKERVDHEIARLLAKSRALTEDKVDANVVRLMDSAQDMVSYKASELAYKKMGLLTEKMQHSGEGGGPLVFTLRRIEGSADE